MSTTIQDGTGSKRKVSVNVKNRLEAQTISTDEERDATRNGEAYTTSSSSITLTGTSETAVLYLKNTDDRDMVVDRAVMFIGSSVGATATDDWTLKIIRNPAETGTIITNAVTAGISNGNHGSSNLPNAIYYRGVEGDTMGGNSAGFPIQQQSNRYIYPVGKVLPKGSSIGAKVTPPASNTSTRVVVVMHFYYI